MLKEGIKLLTSYCSLIPLFLMVGFGLSSDLYANSMYPLRTAQQEAQFSHLLRDLRCLVCQNQDLADSNADLAQDLRRQVYESVLQGKTDQEIEHYLTDRYGDFILFKPPVNILTSLLWFGPIMFFALGGLILWRSCFLRGRHD